MKLSLALLSVVVFFASGTIMTARAQDATSLSITTKDGNRHNFSVELALTPQQQQYGLMNRTSMDPDHGMLFVFVVEENRSFWMKNTLIPLDMIFIKKNGVIHHIATAKANDLTSVPSNGPVSAVLELNAGVAKSLGIKPGDVVKHVVFGNTK